MILKLIILIFFMSSCQANEDEVVIKEKSMILPIDVIYAIAYFLLADCNDAKEITANLGNFSLICKEFYKLIFIYSPNAHEVKQLIDDIVHESHSKLQQSHLEFSRQLPDLQVLKHSNNKSIMQVLQSLIKLQNACRKRIKRENINLNFIIPPERLSDYCCIIS